MLLLTLLLLHTLNVLLNRNILSVLLSPKVENKLARPLHDIIGPRTLVAVAVAVLQKTGAVSLPVGPSALENGAFVAVRLVGVSALPVAQVVDPNALVNVPVGIGVVPLPVPLVVSPLPVVNRAVRVVHLALAVALAPVVLADVAGAGPGGGELVGAEAVPQAVLVRALVVVAVGQRGLALAVALALDVPFFQFGHAGDFEEDVGAG